MLSGKNTGWSLAIIAVNRFGYGAIANDLQHATLDPVIWVKQQLQPVTFDDGLPHSSFMIAEHERYREYRKLLQEDSTNASSKAMFNKEQARKTVRQLSLASLKQAIKSPHSVSWRLLDFFSNHFSVSATGRLMTGLAPTLEREAIASNLLGTFEDMLLAVEQHPAMIIYLNNEQSVGPNSKISKKRQSKGLNENLAREILELHTLGVNGGYQQTDVIELAKGVSGWSIDKSTNDDSAGFRFRKNAHEPGTRTLLGKRYSQTGITQGQMMLSALANHPQTIAHICRKIACHFVSETPDDKLLVSMHNAWKATNGSIKAIMHTMFESEYAWLTSPQKFKTPREFIISTYRSLGTELVKDNILLSGIRMLGQQPFKAGTPAGYSDKIDDWLGANALVSRIDWIYRLTGTLKHVNAENLMNNTLGLIPNHPTYLSVIRAESRHQALALLFLSPEFLRR